jgi:CMP-N-acetylneuraminate monooxygenase
MGDLTWVTSNMSSSEMISRKSAKIELSPRISIWLINEDGDFQAFFDKCAHMGSPINFSNGNFVCNAHNWTYISTGQNKNPGSPNLSRVAFKIIDDYFCFQVKKNLIEDASYEATPLDGSSRPKLKVHSHACVELEYENSSILIDPWIEGPAYYGSWSLFPQPVVRVQDLNPDVVLITHPHPDHFHPETISKMRRDVKIYYPPFASGIIERKLDELGFTNHESVMFGKDILLGKNLSLKFLQPYSFWEDSSILISAGKWRWLNQNDAGSVLDDSQLPPSVDLFSTMFDLGASGYPLTWTGMSDEIKSKMMNLAKQKMLSHLPERAKQVGAVNFLPFAGHWRLGLPQHQKYADMIPHISLDEVTQAFQKKNSTCNVLALLPGEDYDFFDNKATQNQASRKSYMSGYKPGVEVVANPELKVDTASLKRSLELLAKNSDAQRCERVDFTVAINGENQPITVRFGIEASEQQPLRISVEIPSFIADMLIKGLANWDHISIGYWGVWSRFPDVYPPNFMRLLQVGYVDVLHNVETDVHDSEIEQISIADLLERNPSEVAKVLSRSGMPCLACSRNNSESLSQAFHVHSISQDWQTRTLIELKHILLNSPKQNN